MIPVFDYYGLIIGFEEKVQLPIQIIGERNGLRTQLELEFKAGRLQDVRLIKKGLDAHDQTLLMAIVEANSSELIKAWLNVFLYQLPVNTELLTQKF